MLELYHNTNSVCLAWMAESLKEGAYLAGDAFSNADAAEWWLRIRGRPSVKAAIFDRMGDNDWAPFKNLSPDPWPKVQTILKAA